jgi:hypothetical protein
MTLTYNERESMTRDYFMADNKKAVDIYFNSSFLLNWLIKQKKGIWKMVTGGDRFRIPLEYDGQEAGFYGRGDTISSNFRENVNNAYFLPKHVYGNATILRIDELGNNGEYAEVEYLTSKLSGAQKSLSKLQGESIYDLPGAGANRFDGLRACCNETAATAYGGLAENDLVAEDGTKPWEGKMNSTATVIALNALRTGRSAAKIRDGAEGKPDLLVTTETNFNTINDLLQAQQRFAVMAGKETVKAGFTGIWFEGMEIFPDDYCPASHAFFLNSKHIGFAVYKEGFYKRTPWRVIESSPDDKTMKIYFDGNMVVNNRKAHQGYSSIS